MEKCPFCASHSRLYVEVFGDALFKCSACGLVFLSPYPDRQEMIRRHQTEDYANHPYFKAGEEIAEKEGLELHHFLLTLLKSRLPSTARILDVGAGSGDFLSLAAPHFQVSGVEPSPYLAERIEKRVGCPVFVGAFEDYQDSMGFDAVVLIDIIEHTADPRQLLQKAFDTLRPGGLLVVCTVDSNALLYHLGPLVWRLSGSVSQAKYILQRIFCYQHNWYFNRNVLKGVIQQAGFSILEHKGYEFPLNRLQESFIIVSGLRMLYLVQKILGSNTEQYLLAQKK
jgi:2-polyprenyl-3-methyl-5-hydroxy-6-metoxy-1,4-benzoquinol methylase